MLTKNEPPMIAIEKDYAGEELAQIRYFMGFELLYSERKSHMLGMPTVRVTDYIEYDEYLDRAERGELFR